MIDSKQKKHLDDLTGATEPEWFVSRKGNPCMVVGEHLITVFKGKVGFKWVINNTQDDEAEPLWSKDFCINAEQAKADALNAVKRI
jgi:hypothetical protein